MILQPSNLNQRLADKHVFLDTNVFSHASRHRELADFLLDLRQNRCSLVTIPSVIFEMTNGSPNIQVFNDRRRAILDIVDRVDPIRWLDGSDVNEFTAVMAKINGTNPSLIDFSLAACLFTYSSSPIYLMSADLKMLPELIFEREFVITLDAPGKVITFGYFKFNNSKFDTIVRDMAK